MNNKTRDLLRQAISEAQDEFPRPESLGDFERRVQALEEMALWLALDLAGLRDTDDLK